MQPGQKDSGSSELGFAALPASRSAGSGCLVFFATVAVIAVCVMAYWLTRTTGEQTRLRQHAAAAVNDFLADTPLAGLGNVLAAAPDHNGPPTEAGTLAGHEITGTIAAPMDFGPIMPRAQEPASSAQKSLARDVVDAAKALAGIAGQDDANGVTFSREALPPVTEDPTVSASLVASFARWLGTRYKPTASGGSLNLGIQALSQEWGVRLAGQVAGGRSALLRYAFHPAMIDGLYRLYIDRFLADLDMSAQSRGFTSLQNRQFHEALAGRTALFAEALAAVVQIPELDKRMRHIDALAQKAVDASTDLTAAVFELDEQRAQNASAQALKTAQLRVTGAAARSRLAADAHAQAQAELASAIRRQAGPGLDTDALLFIAAFAARRQTGGADAQAALQTCVQTLHNLAARLRAAPSE